jgi:thiamine-monophosphate kinase
VVPPKPEDAIVQVIANTLETKLGKAPDGEVWLGDDSAVLAPPRPGDLVLTSIDATVEGVHVDLALASLSDVGWKALTVAVSDLAAMGGRPSYALVSVSGPPGLDFPLLYEGLVGAAATWGCPIVGGDVTAADQLVISVAVTGTSPGPPEQPPVRRSGALVGDTLLVTGPCGASAAGLRLLRAGHGPSDVHGLAAPHRRPMARLAEGWVARRSGTNAMMDISDGLSIDLSLLLAASGLGAALDLVPVAPGATEADALGGGEDYELLMAVADPDRVLVEFAAAGLRPPLRIGRCTGEPGIITLQGEVLPITGWQHTF